MGKGYWYVKKGGLVQVQQLGVILNENEGDKKGLGEKKLKVKKRG